ncbi:nitroreductase family protein [Spiribacter halobius]|uniref:Nitroreductase n=1 Tax=Sediminicurvatus halobius TaxID=2182432 RepID=A0A2U2N1H6_9GAMM|nr:nitroreductase [Spiribacter halobius]PWG62917.1 nitroreductase [Spiribacter halobius]UEX77427.1 nitroreductase [Spiribacter halobius]
MAIEPADHRAPPAPPSPDAVGALLRGRRSIARFRPEPVPRERVLDALEAACWAPNHHLTEPWRFRLLGPQAQAAIVELNAELVTAKAGPAAGAAKRERWAAIPGWLLVTCERSSDPLRAEEDYAACACAVQNFALHLWSAGVGTKWTTGEVTRDPRFHDLVWMDPEAERVVGLVWYGYPDESPDSTRRPLESVLVELP